MPLWAHQALKIYFFGRACGVFAGVFWRRAVEREEYHWAAPGAAAYGDAVSRQ